MRSSSASSAALAALAALAATLGTGVALAAAPAPAPAAEKQPPAATGGVTPEQAEFFEKRVRPVLAENCFSCHGAKQSQSGLRLDSRAFILKGMDGGRTAMVAGDPEKSPLVQAVRYGGGVKMPPKGKLPQPAIDAISEWVKMGAPWPGEAAAPAPADPKKHWAFQPVRKPAVPAVKNAAWPKAPLDNFVLAKLEAKGIVPNRPADRRTLIRRAYFDLIGLPPTAEQVEAFVADKSPTAFSKVVDELLADRRYGERWGRYWLDVARYADTKGYVFQEERRYANAYTYRDWVINSLNDDLPYDQFLIRQIAADRVPSMDKHELAAMGFLTLGRRFLNNQADIIDDRLDTLFRGTQGLTVACARCHDHKFDPIPTKDYYSLYGVFASSQEPGDLPEIGGPASPQARDAYEGQLKALQGNLDRFLASKQGEIAARLRSRIGDYLTAATDAGRGNANLLAIARERDLSAVVVTRWKNLLAECRRAPNPVFAPWIAFSDLPAAEFAAKAPALAARFAANSDSALKLNPIVAKAFAGKAPASLKDVADRYQALFTAPATGGPDEAQIQGVLTGENSPINLPASQLQQAFNRADRNQLTDLRAKIDRLKATSPGAPARAMVLVDLPQPVTPRVFKRGNPNNPGDEVPRQMLAVIAGPERKPFQHGSGRLEMAEAIASKDNPLTARVIANRVWMWHFGSPLVRTPSDFGLRSDPPTNPELLDYLASTLMEDGWSLKKLHRRIMLSRAYQQASDYSAASAAKDPENSLYWRMNRRRLDFEATRDSLLSASGALDETPGGPAVDLVAAPFTPRRSVYGFIDRQNLPNLFRTFDFASPDSSSPGRFQTTVPQQALFLMNSPFVIEQAKRLAERPEVATGSDPDRVRALYRIVYARDPLPDEVQLAIAYLKSAGTEAPRQAAAPVWQYGWGTVNESAGRLAAFNAFTLFTGGAWQGGPMLPAAGTGWASLTAIGGHPGDKAHPVVRRWTAPQDCTVAVSGALVHPAKEGDGVRARVISSRTGIVGTWTAHGTSAGTEIGRIDLKQGDTLDFVVDCIENESFDSFSWSPTVRATTGGGHWDAREAFGGPKAAAQALSPWEKYAQVLLLSNEFVFVD